ncbi:MAG: hypothetical protein ACLR5H_09390 [Oscillospiraceae bacterium]
MLLPPEENLPITAELLADPEDWQLKNWKTAFQRDRRSTVNGGKAGTAGASHPGWENHVLCGKAGLSGSGDVQRFPVLFHLHLHRCRDIRRLLH